MSAPEVGWTIDQLGSVITDINTPLRRVDRDESIVYDGDGSAPDLTQSVRELKKELQRANYVGVTFVDRAPTAIGTEYDHEVEAVVSLRIVGLHYSDYGYIDPEGAEGIAFEELTRRIRRALLASRTFPDAGDANTSYTDLQFTNEADTSNDYKDAYRYDVDVAFHGYETLP